MRTMTALALAAAVSAVAAPTAAHYLMKPSEDPLGDTLRTYGFEPITPASNLVNVGSLYYVDSSVRDFKAICNVDKADVEGLIASSSSWKIQESLERNGQLTTGIKIDLGWLLKGSHDENYVVKVQSSLTDVVLQEIPLGPNWEIFARLMKKPLCGQMAMKLIHAGGYVCQGQKTLQATAEYKLDRDVQSKLGVDATATPSDIKDIVKLAVESQGEQAVVAKEGRLLAGTSLTYGVSMNPLCLAPPNGRFERVLPHTVLGRVANYVLFNIVEPLLPIKPDQPAVAQAGDVADGSR